jgi:hypothetical protein
MTRIEIETTDYEFEYGKKPSGFGSWAFAYRRNADLSEIFWVHGNYALAKQVARQRAKTERQPTVHVMP